MAESDILFTFGGKLHRVPYFDIVSVTEVTCHLPTLQDDDTYYVSFSFVVKRRGGPDVRVVYGYTNKTLGAACNLVELYDDDDPAFMAELENLTRVRAGIVASIERMDRRSQARFSRVTQPEMEHIERMWNGGQILYVHLRYEHLGRNRPKVRHYERNQAA